MKAKHFLSQLEHARIVEAIQAAERGTSGDIVLFITHRHVSDALAAAQRVFNRRHVSKIADERTLLLFIAPKSQTFAVVGGTALHDRVGQVWWDALIELMRRHFKAGDYMGGLLAAIGKAGAALREHFPDSGPGRTTRAEIVDE